MTPAAEALEAFCAAAPVQRLPYNGVTWQYRVYGCGPQGLLLLPGAVGDGEAYYPHARVHMFPGAGHAISAQRRDEWAAAIAEFLVA